MSGERSFVCPNCACGSVTLPQPAACKSCGQILSRDQVDSLRSLEAGLRTYMASLIECIDEAPDDATFIAEVGKLIDDPPGIASICRKDKMRFDMSVIRAKYFILKKDFTAAENSLAKSD